MDIAVGTPYTGNGFGHRLRRQELGLIVVPNGHIRYREIPERRLGVDDRVVEAAEVRGSGHLLIAGITLAFCDSGICGVCVAAPVVQVCKIEAVVRE
jgi:hypothetical protein